HHRARTAPPAHTPPTERPPAAPPNPGPPGAGSPNKTPPPAGNVSVSTTPGACVFPVSDAVIVYVMFPPAAGNVATLATFVIDRSDVAFAAACTVSADALSLLALSSGVPETTAVLWNVIGLVVRFAGTDTTIDTVADELPAANVPNGHVTVADPEHGPPCDRVADTNTTPAGNVSVTTTPVACVFPVCDAVIVYVMFPPAAGNVATLATFVIHRSDVAFAAACTVSADALSLLALSSGVPETTAVLCNVIGLVVRFAGTDTTI